MATLRVPKSSSVQLRRHVVLVEDGVEQVRVFAVAVVDQTLDGAARVFDIHDEVAGGLGDPGGAGMGGGGEDAGAAGGVLDGGQDVHPGAGQRHGLEEVDRDDPLGLRA
jgi:hypothetical protein